ncbi:hypothetical protein [Bradyrhizobium sp.]|uniref:hypothetical protein n=1 Tax=Bradyrhizobium sp. TaxID=376 RepID=UPI004037F874
MKRLTVFLIVGPSAVAFIAALVLAAAGAPASLVQILPVLLFFLTFPVATLAAAVDGYLARSLPIVLRAPVTAIAGAVAASALASVLLHCFFPPSELMFVPLAGAVLAGACSLLANDYGWRETATQANGPLRN